MENGRFYFDYLIIIATVIVAFGVRGNTATTRVHQAQIARRRCG